LNPSKSRPEKWTLAADPNDDRTGKTTCCSGSVSKFVHEDEDRLDDDDDRQEDRQ